MYSNSESNTITVQKCSFKSNKLINPTSQNSIFGGSAIYMNTQKVSMKFCMFSENDGESSVKIDYNFDDIPSSILNVLDSSSPVEIDRCEFEINSNAKS